MDAANVKPFISDARELDLIIKGAEESFLADGNIGGKEKLMYCPRSWHVGAA